MSFEIRERASKRLRIATILLLVAGLLLVVLAGTALADPSGAETGTGADILPEDPSLNQSNCDTVVN